MGAEIQVIKLCREMLGSDMKKIEKDRTECYFATDYFDSLIVEPKEPGDSFAAIMNLKSEEDEHAEEMKMGTVQSYTLYFSERMEKEYESVRMDSRRRSPFGQTDQELRFLSVIQVHITPEIYRRMEYGEEKLWNSDNAILKPFLDDLYDILRGYETEDSFVYRIYQVLSAGDFAVVIKSGYPETSFRISTRLRKRTAGVREGEEQKGTSFAIYKTYTLLTMHREADLHIKSDERKAGNFVIRGCYSCRYWAHREDIELDVGNKIINIPAKIQGLNGRYDFSLELTEEEFGQIYPFILQAKGMGEKTDAKPDENASDSVRYLIYLLKQNYLSYINERYLLQELRNDTGNSKETDISRFVLLKPDSLKLRELKVCNDEYMQKLMKKYTTAKKYAKDFAGVHKNLEQYLGLLREQISSCQVINQFADTRIYAREIGMQLEAVLDSFEIYWKIYKATGGDSSIRYNTVEYVREAVHAVNSYAEYVRNNNLQSLQTPNYDLESNMSMEKIMIGYSRYLKDFMECYRGILDPETNGVEKRYLPMVIPDLHSTDMCVEALFQEGQGSDWEREKEIRSECAQENGGETYLLVIDSPTLAELGDVPVFMALLFHELAHQFRYESRETRNITILLHLIREFVSQLAGNIAREIGKELNILELIDTLYVMLRESFEKAIQEEIVEVVKEEGLLDTPLNYFLYEIKGVVEDFSKSWDYQKGLEEYVKRFVKSLGKECNLYREPLNTYIAELGSYIKKEKENGGVENGEEGQEVLNKIIKYEWLIACLAAYEFVEADEKEYLKAVEWVEAKSEVRKWLADTKTVKYTTDLCFAVEQLKNERKVWHIWNIFMTFGIDMHNHEIHLNKRNFKCSERILEKAYTTMCAKWSEKNKAYVKCLEENKEEEMEAASALYRSWALVGRYLGVDCQMQENCKRFCRTLRKEHFFAIDIEMLNQRIGIYRETTADMFMYAFMNMTPFAYLNLIAQIIPEENLFDLNNNLPRIVNVIYVMEKEPGSKPDCVILGKAYVDLLENLEAYCAEELEQKEIDFIRKILLQCKNAGPGYVAAEQISHISDMLMKKLEQKETDGKERTILMHIAKICGVMKAVLGPKGAYIISLLKEERTLLGDYEEGAQKLRELYGRIKQEGKTSVQQLLNLGEKNAQYLAERHYKTGEVTDGELNEDSIRFLLRQYYTQKMILARVDDEEDDL